MAKELIYVNAVKKQRADDIILLVSGARDAKNEEDRDTKSKFTAYLKEAEVDIKDVEEATQFVYSEKLGGLLRTHEEVAKAKKVKPAVNKAKAKPAKKADTLDDEDDEDGE